MSPCAVGTNIKAVDAQMSYDGSFGPAPSNTTTISARPVINLKATTTVKSGTGTANDPYVIE